MISVPQLLIAVLGAGYLLGAASAFAALKVASLVAER